MSWHNEIARLTCWGGNCIFDMDASCGSDRLIPNHLSKRICKPGIWMIEKSKIEWDRNAILRLITFDSAAKRHSPELALLASLPFGTLQMNCITSTAREFSLTNTKWENWKSTWWKGAGSPVDSEIGKCNRIAYTWKTTCSWKPCCKSHQGISSHDPSTWKHLWIWTLKMTREMRWRKLAKETPHVNSIFKNLSIHEHPSPQFAVFAKQVIFGRHAALGPRIPHGVGWVDWVRWRVDGWLKARMRRPARHRDKLLTTEALQHGTARLLRVLRGTILHRGCCVKWNRKSHSF